MRTHCRIFIRPWMGAFAALGVWWSVPALAADTIKGQVVGAGAPIIGSTVTLWAASAGAPRQLAQAQTGSDGRFEVSVDGEGANLYLIAKGGHAIAANAGGDNPAISFLTVVGN